MSCIHNLGMSQDKTEQDTLAHIDDHVRQSRIQSAHAHIYDSTLGVTSMAVESLLKDQSLVPILVCCCCFALSLSLNGGHPLKNAFSNRLSSLGFNLFCMLVVDLMHEFELGIWKALFTHLICILSASEVGDILVNELDHHYRMVPTFGGDTIRKFASNTSEMKRMAAHDFEDVLQVSLPPHFFPFEFLLDVTSVQSQYLMDYFPSHTIKMIWLCYLHVPIGMGL